MLKYLIKNKTLFIILILALWLVPSTIGVPEQSRAESIVIAVGIDKLEDEYEVSLQYIIPSNASTSEKLDMTSAKDKSVDGAIQKLNTILGKYSGFAHCRIILFNEEAGKNGVTKMLDCFLRLKTNTNNIVLASTKDSAKKVLKSADKLDSNFYSFLNNSAFSNELRGYEDLKSIGDYYNSYFGLSKCIDINFVELKKDEESGNSEKSSKEENKSEKNQEDGSEERKPEKIINEGKLVVIKNDNELIFLDKEQSENIKWFNKNIKRISFEVPNFNDENLKNANLRFIVYNKTNNLKAYFKDDKPYIDMNIKIYVRTSEVLTDRLEQKDYEVQQQVYTDKLYQAIENQIVLKLKSCENFLKQNKLDCLDFNEMFYKFANKQYLEKLKTQTKDEFLQSISFNYSVEIDKGA